MNIILRSAEPKDENLMAELLSKSLAPHYERTIGHKVTAEAIKGIKKWFNENMNDVTIITESNNDIGSFLFKKSEHGNLWNLSRFWILPQWQNKGIGSQIMHELTERVPKNSSINIEILKKNTCISFYVKHGFEHMGNSLTDPNCYAMKFIK